MARLNYVSQTKQSVTVSYTDLPPGVALAFVNDISGAKTSATSDVVKGGSGSSDISISGLPAGEYHLLAENDGVDLAQTVKFYIA
jgi:hypothetical protein